jgi:biotin carboxyl carrier protein
MENPTTFTLVVDDTTYETQVTRKFASRKRYAPPNPDELRAFIPGVIQALHVKEGSRVTRGAPLLVLEAMKMRNDVVSPRDGRVERIHVRVGDMVTKNQLVIEFGS